MTCSYCGTDLPPGAMFCGECGRSVTAKTVPIGAPVQVEVVGELQELIEPSADHPPIGEAEGEVEPEVELEVEPEVEPDVVVQDTCAQCGTGLAPEDIFCGECGFVRQSVIPAPSPAPTSANDTAGLDPFPWGLPRTVVPESSPPTPAVPVHEDSAFEADIDETRIVDRSARGERFVLQFSTGESVSVTGTGLLGRNPIAEPGEFVDALVVISDPGKSVSKTHLEFGQEGASFWVSDRFSGNGTIVREPDLPPRRCEPGKRYRIARGSRVDIGEQFFIVS